MVHWQRTLLSITISNIQETVFNISSIQLNTRTIIIIISVDNSAGETLWWVGCWLVGAFKNNRRRSSNKVWVEYSYSDSLNSGAEYLTANKNSEQT